MKLEIRLSSIVLPEMLNLQFMGFIRHREGGVRVTTMEGGCCGRLLQVRACRERVIGRQMAMRMAARRVEMNGTAGASGMQVTTGTQWG